MKGKHAATAARRQAEAALAMSERLADKNAELKLRARQVESDAAMVPALRARIRELEAHVEQSTSPRLTQLMERLDEEQIAHADKLDAYWSAVVAVVHLACTTFPDRYVIPAFVLELADAEGRELPTGRPQGRDVRRAQRFKATDFHLHAKRCPKCKQFVHDRAGLLGAVAGES